MITINIPTDKPPRVKSWGECEFSINSQKCGRVSFEFISSHRVILWSLSIDKEYRGKGLAKILMQDIEEILKKNYPHISKILLYVEPRNEVAIKVYRKAGFNYSKQYGTFPGLLMHKIIHR